MDVRNIVDSCGWSALMRENERSMTIKEDPRAFFDQLYQQYYPAILSFLRFLTGKRETAEDLTSLVFEKALTHLADVRKPGATGTWLFRIARNCATDYFRSHQPAVSLEHLADQLQMKSLEETIIAREEQIRLLKHLSRLSARERTLIGLKYVAELNNREIALVLQLPEGTVSSSLHRILVRLRSALCAEEANHEEGL